MNNEIVPNEVPVLRRRDGAVFVEPPDYVPDFRETPSGQAVDLARLRWIAALIIEEHVDSDRLRKTLLTRPVIDVEPGELGGEALLAVRMAGEIIGLFEPELLNAEEGGAMNRTEAIELVDEVHQGYAELLRTGRCPACEALSTITEVDEKHPDHEAHEAAAGRPADGYLQWESVHAEGCSFMTSYRNLPALAAEFHIVLAARELVIHRDDGSALMDFVPVRIPAPGDPPPPA